MKSFHPCKQTLLSFIRNLTWENIGHTKYFTGRGKKKKKALLTTQNYSGESWGHYSPLLLFGGEKREQLFSVNKAGNWSGVKGQCISRAFWKTEWQSCPESLAIFIMRGLYWLGLSFSFILWNPTAYSTCTTKILSKINAASGERSS